MEGWRESEVLKSKREEGLTEEYKIPNCSYAVSVDDVDEFIRTCGKQAFNTQHKM